MYIPKINLMTDTAEIVEFMKRFSFATIITSIDNVPVATHLPFLITRNDEKLSLTSHFAKANNHWKEIEKRQSLIIFSEPHAYISPGNYELETNVPTWNYIAVHAYGQAIILREQEQIIHVLENTINQYESAYKTQWDNLPEDYKSKMSAGIVAFHIEVEDLHAKKKLSQNKKPSEQKKIIQTLSDSSQTTEQLIAEYMERNLM